MPPVGRGAIQEGLVSKDAERSQMRVSTSMVSVGLHRKKFTMKESSSVGCEVTVLVQGCGNYLNLLAFFQQWINKQRQEQHLE